MDYAIKILKNTSKIILTIEIGTNLIHQGVLSLCYISGDNIIGEYFHFQILFYWNNQLKEFQVPLQCMIYVFILVIICLLGFT